MNNKKDNYIISIIIIILLISISVVLYYKNDEEHNAKEETNIVLLKDYSRFFTVNSCIYKYISYLSSDSISDIINILDENFVKSNNINENNLHDYIPKLSGSYTFKSKRVYYEEINKNFITYYVYGVLIEEFIDYEQLKEEQYYIVNMDLKNQTFSITPYDGSIFKEGN